jgi:hypothetical protein
MAMRQQRVASLRRMYEHGHVTVAASNRQLRSAARRGLAIDAHAVAELVLAAGVLADRQPGVDLRKAI